MGKQQMSLRNRTSHGRGAQRAGPYGLGTRHAAMPYRGSATAPEAAGSAPVCDVVDELSAAPLAASERGSAPHPLSNAEENQRLYDYERSVKDKFAAIIPVLKEIAAIQHEPGFVQHAQNIAHARLGFALPSSTLEDAWVEQLDMRSLYAHCVFQAFHWAAERFCDEQARQQVTMEQTLCSLFDCGFHEVDFSPCADGRLMGLVTFILRLPYGAVRRKSYAGAMFDVEANARHWMRTEFYRYREGKPSLPDAGTRYLKIAVYHWSSSDPAHEGCAAHGSNERDAAEAALNQLIAFRQAIENSFCCGASVDILLIGVDTDTDSIKVHIPDADGAMSLFRYVDSAELYRQSAGLDVGNAHLYVHRAIQETARAEGWAQGNGAPHEGMLRLIASLLINNLSQIEYVRRNHGGRYGDIGHNELFISVGEGFEEVQIRNLTYYAATYTVEEGAADLDIGIKIFKKLNVTHGLPIPIIVHYRYDSRVPGSKQRIMAQCRRMKAAIEARYSELKQKGLLVCAMAVQDKTPGSRIEMINDEAVLAHP